MKSRTRLLILIAVLAIVVAACGGDADGGDTTTPDTSGGDASAMLDHSWRLVSISDSGGPIALDPAALITLDWNADGLNAGGTAACNGYFAEYRLGGGSLVFGGIGQTEMACDPPALMEAEATYLAALMAVERWRIEAGELVLDAADSSVELRYAVIVPPDAAPIDSPWTLTSIGQGDAVSSVLAGTTSTLSIDPDAGVLNGDSGCNTFGGPVEVGRDGSMQTGDLAITEIGCDAPVMDQEAQIVAVLADVDAYQVDGNQLTLTARDGSFLVYSTGS